MMESSSCVAAWAAGRPPAGRKVGRPTWPTSRANSSVAFPTSERKSVSPQAHLLQQHGQRGLVKDGAHQRHQQHPRACSGSSGGSSGASSGASG